MGSSQTPNPLEPPRDGAVDSADEARATGVNATGGGENPNRISDNVVNQQALDETALRPGAEAEAWLGRILDDRYRIVRKLGQGGMGAVFVAEHLALRKEVAVKVIKPELAGNGELAVRFAREAMATAQFEHPHVASAIDYGGLPEGGAYFVMQLVKGRSLRSMLRGHGALPWRQVCSLGAQVADALSAARSAGIVHRDLKPDNILVEQREDGSELVKVLDFGIAQLTTTPADSVEGALPGKTLTRVGTVMGTPGYMSPEQSVGDKVDHRSDLYSLGVVLWEALTGRELWTGEDVMAIITRQIKEDAPPLRPLVEDKTVPADLDMLVQQLLARKPAERPDMAGDVRDMLQALSLMPAGTWDQPSDASGRVSEAMRDGLVTVKQQGEALWQRARTGFVRQPKRHQRLQLTIASGLALALLLLAVQDDVPPATPGASAESAAEGDVVAEAAKDEARAGAPKNEARAEAPKNETRAELQKDEARAEAADRTPAEAPKPAEGVLDRVVEAAAAAVKLPAEAMKAVASEPTIPRALKKDVDAMLEGKRVRDRRPAARRILNYRPRAAVPAYLVAIAELESTGGCRQRRDALEGIAKLADPRTRDTVARYHDAPRSGCGFLSLSDCYGCIRRDLAKTMRALGDAD